MADGPKIPIARPWLGDEEAEAVRAPLQSGWVAQGPEVVSFESEFAAYVGARHACAVSSGTTALHAALLALGVGAGDEVITVSHSFIATANAIGYCGATPVFVDVEAQTYNINVELVEAAVTTRTRAILCVHQMGLPCDLAALVALAEKLDVPLIEDAACATGSEINWSGSWERIGRPRGRVACFSFHPRKLLTTGDGGMLTTDDTELDARFRSLRNHGMRTTAAGLEFAEVGRNWRLTDVQAAIGRVQLRKIPEMVRTRREQADRYRELLSGTSLMLPLEPSWARSNWQSYCVRLPEDVNQNDVITGLAEAGISSRPGIGNAHSTQAYRTAPWRCSCGRCDSTKADCLTQSELAHAGGLCLPIYHHLTEQDQERIAHRLTSLL